MENIVIRRATMKDFSDVQKLYHGLFLVEHARDPLIHISWPYEKQGIEFLTRIITGVNTICFIAEMNDIPAGFLIGSLLTDDPIRPCKKAQLISIYVDESHRNQTIGTKLIDEFVMWSKEKNAEKISVIVQHDNSKGLSLYKRLGFFEHLLLMEKDL